MTNKKQTTTIHWEKGLCGCGAASFLGVRSTSSGQVLRAGEARSGWRRKKTVVLRTMPTHAGMRLRHEWGTRQRGLRKLAPNSQEREMGANLIWAMM
jgi:hypothetical protein